MKAVLGGEQPKRRMTTMEQRAYLESAPDRPESYDDGARLAGKLVLEFLERHPEASEMPAENQGEFGRLPDGEPNWEDYRVIREGLYDYMKKAESVWFVDHTTAFDGLTGFMWGWAVNAARRCLELLPVENPAIVEVNI